MPYRQRLQSSVAENPEQLLTIWRQERTYRVGKAFCYGGLILTAIATLADFIWSGPYVIGTDFVLMLGCLISLYLIRSGKSPHYFWWPLYWSFWLSSLPSFWSTGGLSSPFFGVGLAVLYVIGVVMDSKDHSIFYLLFAFSHIPVFFILNFIYPLSNHAAPSLDLTAVITLVTLGAVVIGVQGLLRTERELAREFADHFSTMAKTEGELKKREAQLREAQSIASVGSWEWDIESDKISWSDELFHIFDVKKETFDPSFKAYVERLNPVMREKISTIISDSLNTGRDFVFENKVQTDQGERFVFSRGRAITDAKGLVTKMLGTSQDITDRKRIESELMETKNQLERRVEERTFELEQSLEREKAAKEIAENASQAKMQFLANMSHEIRTPMNSVLGFSELLDPEKHTPEEMKEYLARIRANGNQLMHLIDDILDLSKFEAGRIPIQKRSFSLKTLVHEVVNSFQPSLAAKGLQLDLQFSENIPQRIYSDGHRVSQVLTNLLSNAIKFSDHGKIKINVVCEDNLTIDIEDAGFGISAEGQKNLFQPFSQGDNSIARKFGGSGLGLALSKRIAEALGGKLELKRSSPGVGSEFSFEIPVERDTEGTGRHQVVAEKFENSGKSHFAEKRILLVEDSPDNALLICHYIKPLGLQIDVAIDGQQAVSTTQKNSYDCILMDIQMPGMDGLEATRRIRAQGFRNPIIALTAHALPVEAAKSLSAGCNLHLTKPISKSDLIGTLNQQLSISEGR